MPVLFGPFDGAQFEVPRRTPAGLRVLLQTGEAAAEYELVARDGQRHGLALLPALHPREADRATSRPRIAGRQRG